VDNLTTFPDVQVVRIGDLDVERAAAQATAYGGPASGSARLIAQPALGDRAPDSRAGLLSQGFVGGVSQRGMQSGIGCGNEHLDSFGVGSVPLEYDV